MSVTTPDPPERELFPRCGLVLIAVVAAAAAMVVAWNVNAAGREFDSEIAALTHACPR